MPSDVQLDPLELRLLLEAIRARYGYDLRGYAQGSLERRARGLLAKSGCAHLGELQHRILHDAEFFAQALHGLTVHVSELFRDPQVYRVFRARVVPLLRTYPLIRVWHAGCARGEEAYASAILLDEEALYDRAQIYATDLSARALEDAKAGVYASAQVQMFGACHAEAGGRLPFSDYYTEGYEHIAMKASLRRNILFFQHDLVGDHVFGEMHVIFCRNVFIYFGQALRERVLAKFQQSLCPGGFLCLGSSERLTPGAAAAFSEFAPEARIYRHAKGLGP